MLQVFWRFVTLEEEAVVIAQQIPPLEDFCKNYPFTQTRYVHY